MGKKSKATQGSLGRALLNAKDAAERRIREGASLRHSQKATAGEYSVTEESSLDDFLRTAQLAGTEFTAERQNLTIVPESSNSNSFCISVEDAERIRNSQRQHADLLSIPRRPEWSPETTPAELERMENEAFLEWRRGLAELQKDESLTITPFEKNVEFWRQLWRVIERSHLVVQIVDARNPLLFRSEDLEKYAAEVDPSKKCMLLLNKADLLTERQRKCWADYFDGLNIRVAFFSALFSDAGGCETDAGEEAEVPGASETLTVDRNASDDEEDDDDWTDDDDDDADDADSEDSDVEVKTKNDYINLHEIMRTAAVKNNPGVLSCQELICLFNDYHQAWSANREKGKKCDSKDSDGDRIFRDSESTLSDNDEDVDSSDSRASIFTVGLVGYPNVGKSSIINALLGHKKVSVSSTPGKTKHFQTIFLEPELQLCDCPGLVMPSFVMSKAEMLCLGILPVDQMRDSVPPVGLICAQLPRVVFEKTYGIMLPPPSEDEIKAARVSMSNTRSLSHCSPQDLLTAFAYVRGFMGPKGTTDWGRAGRALVKDYINGRLRYAYPPPGASEAEFNSEVLKMMENFSLKNKILPKNADVVAKLPVPGLSNQRGLEERLVAHEQPIRSVILEEMKRRRLINSRPTTKSIDDRFFAEKKAGFHVKGARRGPIKIVTGQESESEVDLHQSNVSINTGSSLVATEKPWKKHKNSNKKEKLRRVHRDLDCG